MINSLPTTGVLLQCAIGGFFVEPNFFVADRCLSVSSSYLPTETEKKKLSVYREFKFMKQYKTQNYSMTSL